MGARTSTLLPPPPNPKLKISTKELRSIVPLLCGMVKLLIACCAVDTATTASGIKDALTELMVYSEVTPRAENVTAPTVNTGVVNSLAVIRCPEPARVRSAAFWYSELEDT